MTGVQTCALPIYSGGFANAYQGGIRQGGAFELKQVTWGYNNALVSPAVENDPIRFAGMKAIGLRAWFARMPWKRGHSPLTLAPEYEDYVYDQWEHGNFDAFWKQLGIYAAGYYDQFSDAPMVHMSSWYDPYPRTATENYIGLSKRKKGPVRLILGPWTHGDRSLTYAGDVDFGAAATLDGSPPPRAACRAGFCPKPAPTTLPMMHSSTCFASTFARFTASRTAIAPSCTALNSVSDPWNFPTGVRTPEIMTTSLS